MSERRLDSLLQLVADERRRLAIQHMSQNPDGQTTIDDLVDAIRDTVGDKRSNSDDETLDREHLAIQLYHVHLPKLSADGIVDFDPKNGTIQYQPDEEMETVVNSLPAEVPHTYPN